MTLDYKEFSPTTTLKDKVNCWLEYAVLAPSAHNTQPWKCEFKGEVLEVHRDETRTLISDPTSREAHISIGAFIENFSVAARAWGYEPIIKITAFSPSDLLVAKINVVNKHNPEQERDIELLKAITNRHTNRGVFMKETLGKDFESKILSTKEGLAKPFIFHGVDSKLRVSKLVAAGTVTALSLGFMKKELARLVYSSKHPKETGMPINSMVSGFIWNLVSPRLAIHFLNPKRLGAENEKKYATSPALVIIGSTEDGPNALIDAGRLMERILLIATAVGFSHDIAAGPVEIPTLMPILRQEIPSEFRPQVLFRIGRAKDVSLSVGSGRRTLVV